MKQFISSLMVVGALTFFVGCGDEVKSIDYYIQHPEEAKAKIEKCNKMGKMSEEQKQDCGNATEGRFKADLRNLGKSQKIIPSVTEWKASNSETEEPTKK
ncbi:EexN family lipoprotein [Campylobacter sp. RM12640]|uniref:EexN family lipoprotein n=1 Tax=unclassified Campylobacter TaxID=2593542 RepID=UPI001E13679D|nr:EexN family lipoprotein [Campylobacter sp. RM12642]MBZ7982456.1 EexN family lipoprotein [Campylobacter sp. RM12640]MBZ7989961.1 EexN family lipoprotein [Campylobacter sp. RM12635]MBZ8008226.1 EexN family lipoprotein [Campylobacter sp. RM9334]